MTFDIYAFADYSASSPISEQRKHIVLALYDRQHGKVQTLRGLSRAELWIKMYSLLAKATTEGRRVLFGFDHSYTFPSGFYQTLMGKEVSQWSELLTFLSEGNDTLPPLGEPIPVAHYGQLVKTYYTDASSQEALKWLAARFESTTLPRDWAASVNEWFAKNYLAHPLGGPFWGPNFHSQITKPAFPFGPDIREKRLVETYCQSLNRMTMKSIYQIGGNGSVGLQALYGMSYLHQLLRFCEDKDISIFAWPFDGWEPPRAAHVLLEVYPTLYNDGLRSDEDDARACVTWMKEYDEQRFLLRPPVFLSDDEAQLVRLEGWVPGVGSSSRVQK
ncbi:hypothetical protein [Alicyclobacillus sp. ALC3]|uniref:hypothetical protein n=1 Tax=Alicyclobacillus sp. ALC3 TaxID=2796143 RepID=UPI00237956BB|nr:hypothetical protein [Alicyclobacillus sp. ALC3]WDL96009.1 hypothetical protein JC200_16925 [Alicyclobacillus sp. ALC3]